MKNSKYILAGLSLFCIVLIAVTSINNSILAPLRTGVGYVLVPFQSGVNAVGTSLTTVSGIFPRCGRLRRRMRI